MSARPVPIRDGLFSVEVAESGTGRPTLYLHGELLPPTWQPWMDGFATDRRLIAPQHPGFGRSTGLEHLDDLLDLVVYYLDVLDVLDLDAFDLIGESFGGMLAAEIAAFAPRRVRRLALIAPIGLWIDGVPTPDVFGLPASELHQLAWSDPSSQAARGFAPDLGDDAERFRATIERTRSLMAAGKFVWPIADKGLRKRLHRITAPTLLLWGDRDQVVQPAYGRLFQGKIRGSELVTVANAGHFPLLEQPPEAVAALRSFFDR
ncbi:MAG TPA: alpha/beta hydrolase [Chloroflexota bacterium]|nr:alpha/beta hydrolase [Chloroflexota bacterium]